MSTCIEFCGKPRKKNKRPENKIEEIKPEVPMKSNNK